MAGRRKFNRGKFKELVLYLSQQSLEAGDEGFGMVKLNKLLYRADFEAFRLLGHSITGETYEKQEYGPVARDLPIVLDELANAGYLMWQLIPRGPHTRKIPTTTTEGRPDLDQFAPEELELINRAIDELRPHGGKSVSRWSHRQSSGWQAVSIGQEIPYGSAFISTKKLSREQMDRGLQRSRDENWAAIRP